jgi:hypothetical protein
MRKDISQELLKAASRWLVVFALVGGFMYYHSAAPLVTILWAGAGTLVLMEVTAYVKASRGG